MLANYYYTPCDCNSTAGCEKCNPKYTTTVKWVPGEIRREPWICPRCDRSNAPWLDYCSCNPEFMTKAQLLVNI
jgi:hypothetical protein